MVEPENPDLRIQQDLASGFSHCQIKKIGGKKTIWIHTQGIHGVLHFEISELENFEFFPQKN